MRPEPKKNMKQSVGRIASKRCDTSYWGSLRETRKHMKSYKTARAYFGWIELDTFKSFSRVLRGQDLLKDFIDKSIDKLLAYEQGHMTKGTSSRSTPNNKFDIPRDSPATYIWNDALTLSWLTSGILE